MMYASKNEVARTALLDYTCPTVDELRTKLKRETAGARWAPIHHNDLADEVELAAQARGLEIDTERYILSEDRHSMYAHLTFKHGEATRMPEIAGSGKIVATLGYRHDNFQRFRLQGLTGANVHLCDNGLFSGDFLFGFKSTTGNVERMSVSIDAGMDAWEDQVEKQRRLIEFMANESITDDRADQLLMEGMRRKVYAPNQLGKIDAVYRAYQDADNVHHAGFADRNLWSLYNAVTEVAKGWSVNNIERGLKLFPRMLTKVYDADLDLAPLVTGTLEGPESLHLQASRN